MQSVYKVVHVSPTHYAVNSVIGGGEKYVVYMCRALSRAAPTYDVGIINKLIAFGECPGQQSIGSDLQCDVLPGRPWDPYSISTGLLIDRLRDSDVVVVHQCLSAFGLYVASHAKLLNKIIVGLDHGGGEHPLVHTSPRVGRLFHLLHAYSRYGSGSYQSIDAPINVVAGPVDTDYYCPDSAVARDPDLILSVGRLLPHKGFDRIISCLPPLLRLRIIGSGYDSEYRQYLESVSEGKQVEIVEGLSDEEVLWNMRHAGLYVHASTHRDYRGTFYAKPELLGLAPLEAMSTGSPALVSNAGSLPELSNIEGCMVFRDDVDLSEMLSRYQSGQLRYPDPTAMYRDVDSKYGLLAFGKGFLRGVLELFDEAACRQ